MSGTSRPTFIQYHQDYGPLKRGSRKRVLAECRDALLVAVQGRPMWVPAFAGYEFVNGVRQRACAFSFVNSLESPPPMPVYDFEAI